MEEVKLHILRSELARTVGVTYREVLESLISEGILLSYSDTVELVFDKDKARHVQALLSFYEVSETPSIPKNNKHNPED